jgi:nitrogen fixation protein NifU and related proteins
MTSDLEALYRDTIVDHNKHPRNFRALEGGSKAEGFNPLCGDRLTVYLQVENGVIRDATFQGLGCAIAKASASLMTERVKGMTVADAGVLLERVQRMVTAPDEVPIDDIGPLSALAGVRRFPVRVKCAMLAWHTMRAATITRGEGDLRNDVVTTE